MGFDSLASYYNFRNVLSVWVKFSYDHIDFEYAQPWYVSIVNVNFTTDKFIFAEGSKFNLNPHLPLQINSWKISMHICLLYIYISLQNMPYWYPGVNRKMLYMANTGSNLSWHNSSACTKGALHQRKRFWKTQRPSNF
jgi:hypothetical protein